MRDPIPSTRPELLVLIQSQFMMLARFITNPTEYYKRLNKDGPATLGNLDSLSIEELRALALKNAEEILDLILNR